MHTPFNKVLSQLANKTIFIDSETHSLQYPNYFRMDAGILFIINKATHTWLNCIQNLTNNNVAYKYCNIYFKKVGTKYHLDIIPAVNYKIEF